MPHTQAQQPDHARTPRADFRVTYHGTVTTITPLSDRCREWVETNVEIEPWQRFGNAIAVEPRYVEQLAEAMIEDGLVVEADDPSEEEWGAMLL
jgi:hypothetical protein